MVWRDDAGLKVNELRRLPLGDVIRLANTPAAREGDHRNSRADEHAGAPARRPDPAEFYGHVALRYFELLRECHRPAAAMAEESGVPVSTVHRWIAEARRRGDLPKGRKGAAG
jgi:hypothetical protein